MNNTLYAIKVTPADGRPDGWLCDEDGDVYINVDKVWLMGVHFFFEARCAVVEVKPTAVLPKDIFYVRALELVQ